MTSRLRRKLDNLGVDTASFKANESFCLLGTPLPPLEKSKDTGEFVPLWKQEVRDEKGRKRLHGAFTGGFSAGYFNSVGSAEGWTPSTFTSSRGERAKQKVQRPEDFMDEEDKAELAESRQLVDLNEETDLNAPRTRQSPEADKDSMALAIQDALLPATQDSAGARLLKKIGWRPGQGVGPRVTWAQRRLQDARASAAPSAEDITQATIEDDTEANKHLYAPRDTKLPIFARKDNSHGLGYVPGMSLNSTEASGSKGPNISAGFGLGALNDADDDDVDVYDAGPARVSRLVYEVDDANDGDTISVGRSRPGRGDHKQKGGQAAAHIAQPPSSDRTFSDGKPVLTGFLLSTRPLTVDACFPLPDVPKGWTPDPRRVWENKDKENHPPPSSRPKSENWRLGKSADERGVILGETPLPTGQRSVFDYLSQKDRDRLKAISENMATGAATQPDIGAASTPSLVVLDPQIAKAALSGFQPFRADPQKQARYTAYLQNQVFLDSDHPLPNPNPGQTKDAFNREMSDFAKAAQIFKPMSGAMANRFTSAAIIEHGPKVHIGLHTPSADASYVEEAPVPEQEKDEDPKIAAARNGMFGPLTREVKEWQPSKLLCKRFAVKDPHPEPSPPDMAEEAGTSNSWQPDAALTEANLTVATASYGTGDYKPFGKQDLANIGLGDDQEQGRDTLTYQRPSMDLFKAIFADDEDDEDEADTQGPEPTDPVPASTSQPSVLPDRVPSPLLSSHTVGTTIQSVPPTFKPTFVPRPQRDNAKDTVKKDKKKKSGKSTLMSFGQDEDDGMAPISVAGEGPSKKKKKKKLKESRVEDGDDDGMWVEKPVPEIARTLEPGTATSTSPPEKPNDVPSKRKRAIDFM